MKHQLALKLWQYLQSRRSSRGFTLIELLVVIIIIGILAAIAVPSYLNQSIKAKQSEAKLYLGLINRAQQAYYFEKEQFAPTLPYLALGTTDSTINYTYSNELNSVALLTGVAQYSVDKAEAKFPNLKAHAGLVVAKGDTGSLSVLCAAFASSDSGGTQTPTYATAFKDLTVTNAIPQCNDTVGVTGFEAIK